MLRWLAVSVLFAALGAAGSGCGQRRMPTLGIGPYTTGPGLILEDVVRAAELAGYLPRDVDERHGRFRVLARADRRGRTTFLVQCTADGWIAVMPEGPEIERDRGRLALPGGVAHEYAELVIALEAAIPTRLR